MSVLRHLPLAATVNDSSKHVRNSPNVCLMPEEKGLGKPCNPKANTWCHRCSLQAKRLSSLLLFWILAGPADLVGLPKLASGAEPFQKQVLGNGSSAGAWQFTFACNKNPVLNVHHSECVSFWLPRVSLLPAPPWDSSYGVAVIAARPEMSDLELMRVDCNWMEPRKSTCCTLEPAHRAAMLS